MIRPNRSFAVACARKKFESMTSFALDLIITNSSGCSFVLDHEQRIGIPESSRPSYLLDGASVTVD
jgi:hypothetical protein